MVRIGGGGAGVQFRNAGRAIGELRSAGVLGTEAPFELVTGDSRALLRFLGGEAPM